MTGHVTTHPLAGHRVTLDGNAQDPHRGLVVPGAEFVVEDWWDRVAGGSWMDAAGNPAAMLYGYRIGLRGGAVPLDDEVVYGKIGSHGTLVHVSELPS